MSALDAQLAPHQNTPEAKERLVRFFNSPDRVAFALGQNVLPRPGVDFQYTDVTPQLIVGVVQYATKRTLYDFAEANLFGPMQFENAEWMHEDAAAFDNGSYGLRLRPVDMQKFGILYLNEGCWEGRRLISSAWVKTSFTP
jgi:CubicO group peptidase (beta-lactamase class C family)